MKTLVIALAVIAGSLALSPPADAQVMSYPAQAGVTWGGAVLAAPGWSSNPYPSTVLPYSYYGVPPSVPARIYSGYGSSDFPFYGHPYGHPYDRFTWPYMGGIYQESLTRYYYPPVL